jgi:hypothetical protein
VGAGEVADAGVGDAGGLVRRDDVVPRAHLRRAPPPPVEGSGRGGERGESGEVAYRGDWQSGRFLYRRTLRWCEDRQACLQGFLWASVRVLSYGPIKVHETRPHGWNGATPQKKSSQWRRTQT